MSPLCSKVLTPGIVRVRRVEPVASRIALVLTAVSFANVTVNSSFSSVMPVTFSSMTENASFSYSRRWFLNDSARSGPLILGVPIQFLMSGETTLCPPNDSASSAVGSCLRAAYTPAAAPAGPPPIITNAVSCSTIFSILFFLHLFPHSCLSHSRHQVVYHFLCRH